MEKENFKKLEEVVDNELTIVDVYRHTIIRSDIQSIKKYFTKRQDLKIQIESSFPITIEDLSQKYVAVFQKSRRT